MLKVLAQQFFPEGAVVVTAVTEVVIIKTIRIVVSFIIRIEACY